MVQIMDREPYCMTLIVAIKSCEKQLDEYTSHTSVTEVNNTVCSMYTEVSSILAQYLYTC